jgi:N-acetylmuramoyl-L-alanine amidase
MKTLFIFDPGHGGIVDGKYVTPGKRSPKIDNGGVLYEGVNNRDNVRRIMDLMREEGLECIDIVNSELDVSLASRVMLANKRAQGRKCVYISIHSDANGNGVDWDKASGISVYTSKGKTKSDKLASLVIDNLQKQLGTTVKWRTDLTDGDKDKEENFYVLKQTTMPAILCELGFHTNKNEVDLMLSEDFKKRVARSIVDACKAWEKLNV